MSEVCALCLGGDTDIPPFGTLKDAQDLFQPCSTCHLVTHRKCLIDYINSMSFSKIETEMRTDPDTPYVFELNEDNDTDNEPSILGLSVRSRWVSLLGASLGRGPVAPASTLEHWRLSAPCPQCKSKIAFQLKGSAILGFNAAVREKVVDFASYATIALGLVGASAGILSVGVTGLTVCGLNMTRVISPTFLDSLRSPRLSQAATQMKLHQISLLPVIMYRMRGSSLMDCLFKRCPGLAWPEIVNELLICNFLSALGNHVLAKALWRNFKKVWMQTQGPRSLWGLVCRGKLLENIPWTSTSVLIALVIPFRWAYDLMYRQTINRVHFSLVRSVRPKDLADSLTPQDFGRLETLGSRISDLGSLVAAKLLHAKKSASLRSIISVLQEKELYEYLHCRFLFMLYKSKACLVHDYSGPILRRSRIVTFATTVLWPFLGAYLGKAVCRGLAHMPYVSPTNLPMISNLLGMAILAVVKDAYNLFLCYQKSRQLSNLTILKTDKMKGSSELQRNHEPLGTIPGGFTQAPDTSV